MRWLALVPIVTSSLLLGANALADDFVGARTFYAGLEVDGLYGKSVRNQASGMLALNPLFEFHLTPRWSAQAHGMVALGLGGDAPEAWWDLGVRAIWRPPLLPAQSFGLGLGVGQAKERR